MATSMDWGTDRILVPKADMPIVQVSPEIREFDASQLHLDLRTLQADGSAGVPRSNTHIHVTEQVLSGFTYARFVVILDPYQIEFEFGAYSVKVVGANHNLADVQVQNGVGIITNNSAGLVNLAEARAMLYQGAVTIDLVNGAPGFTGTRGTQNDPVNNLDDALEIASRVNVRTFDIKNGTVILNQDVPSFVWRGKGNGGVAFSGYDVDGGSFSNLSLSGVLGGTGDIETEACEFTTVSNLRGRHIHSYLYQAGGNDIVLSGNTQFVDSKSFAPGPSVQPTVSTNGLPISVEFRGHIGGLRLADVTHASSLFSIDAPSASVVLDASCTNCAGGVIRGQGNLTRADSMGALVNDAGFKIVGGEGAVG